MVWHPCISLVVLALGGTATATETVIDTPDSPPPSGPHIPEPMIFDLVRQLGAAPGELEVNVLVLAHQKAGTVAWAPEVEWAFARGHAIELELPLVDRSLEAVKLALQGTFPWSPSERFIHGWQALSEVELSAPSTSFTGLYVAGYRFSGYVSALLMAGGRADLNTNDGRATASVLGNASLFVEAGPWQTWGIEGNVLVHEHGAWTVRIFPQGHLQINQHLRLQVSLGLEVEDQRPGLVGGVRVVLES